MSGHAAGSRPAVAPRFFIDAGIATGRVLALPPDVARHCQVLRLQPGDTVVLFDGRGGEWTAAIRRMGAREVEAEPLHHDAAADRELAAAVTLAFGMPANDRMDGLIEKATELGAAALQPLVCARSVLRLDGERADKKVAHWRKVATAAAEQCGRTRVPAVHPVRSLVRWLDDLAGSGTGEAPPGRRLLLSPPAHAGKAEAPPRPPAAGEHMVLLSGPEGGLTADEQAAAERQGHVRLCLGARVLRADTAPLAALAWAQYGGAAGGAPR